MNKITIVDFRADSEWLQRVRRAADRKGVSLGAFIRVAVDYYLNRHS
ncbi:MAG: ribbon-helix-helix protein, CopG family [Oscillospiraceae bacterium]|nr:ribbon-helix-helix protein, CopG family [Oscillospiraceae bacterium]